MGVKMSFDLNKLLKIAFDDVGRYNYGKYSKKARAFYKDSYGVGYIVARSVQQCRENKMEHSTSEKP